MRLMVMTALAGTIIASCDSEEDNSAAEPEQEHPDIGGKENKPAKGFTLVGWRNHSNDPWFGSGSSGIPHYENDTRATRAVCEEQDNGINPVWQEGDKLIIAWALSAYSELPLTSGAGTATATFEGEMYHPHITCYAKNVNNPDLVDMAGMLIAGMDHYFIKKSVFLGQDGTLAGAMNCSLFRGLSSGSEDGNIRCNLYPVTSMLKFDVKVPDGVADGAEATLTYMNGETALARATFAVGADGWNTIYMAVPEGVYTGTQSLVFKSGETEVTETLSNLAVFTGGELYYRGLLFDYNKFTDDDFTAYDGETVTGLIYKVTIPHGATVRLRDAKILNGGIVCEGDATIIVEGTNTIATSYSGIRPGPRGTTLTIKGSGSLTASSDYKPGIGTGYGECGDIVISGGNITALGGGDSPGIGCSSGGKCGNITITNTVKRVTACRGQYSNSLFSIGGTTHDRKYECGKITIGGKDYGDGISESPFIYEP